MRAVTPQLRVDQHNPSVARVGVIAAMPQEFELIGRAFEPRRSDSIGPRQFLQCVHQTTELVLVVSHIGKVAAATTAALLIDRFDVDMVVVTGVAGGVGPDVGVGDIVLADSLVQHDFDLKGVLGFQRFVIPSLGVSSIQTSEQLRSIGHLAAQAVLDDVRYRQAVGALTDRVPQRHVGVIASGDQFIGDASQRSELVRSVPNLLAVEMEGAAVGQVCAEHGVPFVLVRVVSDTAQGEAPADFNLFIESAAALASQIFVREFIARVSV